MKKINFVLSLCLFAFAALAQSPHMINYQGVALNTGGLAIANQTISIRATVHQDNPNGTVLYSEQQTAITDAGGLFNLQIGSVAATGITGTWASINWETGTKFLQIEMDPAGGASFVNMGTQQLVSVPYAEYANNAGALVPTATINPNQITSGGAVTDQVLKYNGTNWIAGNDGLTLPFNGSDSTIYSFRVYNTKASNSIALYGNTTGTGNTTYAVYGISTGANAIGVHGRSTGAGGIGIDGYTNNATGRALRGIHASNGIAVEGKTATGIGVRAECTGNTGTGVYSLSNGVNGLGMYGESANGIGIKGYGNSTGSIGVFGSSLSGTGVLAVSFTGNALEVNGNVKISGGNTNPSNGAVLTSDASGNASWKPKRVAFKVGGVAPSNNQLPEATAKVVHFANELYDLDNNFNLVNGAPNATSSRFNVPVNGLYHFDAFFIIRSESLNSFYQANVTLKLKRAGVEHILTDNQGSLAIDDFEFKVSDYGNMSINTDVMLQANDLIWIEVTQHGGGPSVITNAYSEIAQFSGHLVFAD